MQGIGKEWIVFLEAILAGMIVYSSYTCIRRFRRIVKHNLFAITAEDLVFWIAAGIYLFVQIYYTSDGSIRWNFVLGVAIGIAFLIAVEKMGKKLKQKMYIESQKKSGKSVDKARQKR